MKTALFEMHKLMSRLVLFTVMILCLLFVMQSVGYAGVAPEGFVGVLWGASSEQINKTMRERGYKKIESNNPDILRFFGTFGSQPCDLSFNLSMNSFYQGTAYCSQNEQHATTKWFFELEVKKLSEKYGPPDEQDTRKVEKCTDVCDWAMWDHLYDNNSNKYSIQALVWRFDTLGGKKSHYTIEYKNESLSEQLKKKAF